MSRRRFDYAVPEKWRDALVPGARVRVPFHGRRVGGWVAEVGSTPPPGVVVRELTGFSGLGPPARVLELAEWAAWRWAMPIATLLRTASPERNVWSLPSPPSPRARRGPAGGPGRVTLQRVAPAHDLLPYVLDVVDASAGPVLVLVPATGWAGRLAERLRARGLDVATSWAQAAAGWPVVVASRAGAWAPMPVLGAAVVLDGHDYADRYDATEVVIERARRDGARCLVLSACPTAVQRVVHGPLVREARSVERAGWPVVRVVDRKGADPRTGLFSDELVALVRRVLPERVVCVLQRTGGARLLACAACGTLARCEMCGRAVEKVEESLRCPACGARRPLVCAACGSGRLKVVRKGVSRVREELEALLGVAVGEVAGPLARQGAGAEGGHEVPPEAVLVGTEAVLHRVRRAGAVAFLDFDQHLLAPRYGAGEEALALVARAARLVGGRVDNDAGLLVQTRMPDHPVLLAAVAGDPSLFTELELRRALRLPPYSALATVRAEAPPPVADAGIEVSPLAPGRWLVRAPDHQVLCDAVAGLGAGVRVDPDDV